MEHSPDIIKTFSQLINMGFDDTLSMNAAQTHPNDIIKAINLASNDPLLLKENNSCQKMLKSYGDNYPESERVMLSAKVIKINNQNKQQKRILLLTDKALYNIKSSKMRSCQRRIDFKLIKSISLSPNSNQFTINVPTEYDYHYKANPFDKTRILSALSKLCNIIVYKTETTSRFSQPHSQNIMTNLNKKIITPQIAEITLSQKHTSQISKTISKSNWTNSKHNLLMYGYIRQYAFRMCRINMDSHIIEYCLLYLCIMYDSFDAINIWKEDDFINISENNKILSVGKNDLLKQVVYGMYNVKCKMDNNCKTFIWKLRVNRIKNDSTIYIGIGDKNHKTLMYKAGRSSFKQCSMYKNNQNIGQMLQQLERGDYIDIILDMVTHKLMFLINCDTQHMVKNIQCDNNEEYRLGVFLSHAQIELKDFTIFDGSWKEYKQSHKVKIEYKTKYFC